MAFFEKILKKEKENKRFIDPITGVYTRDYLKELEREFLKRNFTVILLDIDNFSTINNYYSKHIGDLLLADIVRIIRTSLREEDIVVRIGGDEFLILVEKDGKNPALSYGIGERIIQKLDLANFNIDGNKIKITASAGIYLDANKEANLTGAIEKTDKALLLAKQKGKNRIEIFKDNIISGLNKKLTDIKEAIEDGRVVCFYQPIFDIETFKAVKYESLVRLLTKDRKVISPGMFLNQIVNTRVYKELTKRVVEYNLKVLKQKNIQVSINLLPSEIIDRDFVNFLTSLNSSFKERITIELLESENVADYSILRSNINTLRESGYKVALDDFGSGFSNLMHVVELKFDYIKIDGSIVRKIDKDPISYSLVKAIKGFTSEINMNLVAEFISSEEIFKRIKDIGIKYGQGNFFKEAIPADLIR
ncbi:MAG: bifunctional diguanylate cyclase/phosphodiesterase [Hydrogenothermaceae bacterium]